VEVSVEHTGGLERRVTVQVPAERLEDEVKSRLQSMMRTMRVAGFRPGKVPLRVIEQKYGTQVRQEVIERLVQTTLQEALAQNNIRPAGAPSIEPAMPGSGEPLRYVATFEVFPDFEGGINYSFSVERPVVDITDADVDAMLENLRSQRAGWQVVERAAQTGDKVTIDFEGTIDGKPFSGGSAENVDLVLGSGKMIPGFEEQLEGVTAGDERTLQITFPADYPAAEVAGKAAEFLARARSVAEPVLPALDDAFAASFGVTDKGLAGLREDVTGNMQRELRGMITSRLKDQVFSGLLASNPFEVPRQLIRQEKAEILRQQAGQGQSDEAVEQNAERRVKLGMLISELARRNQIQIDTERVRQMIESIAASYEKPEEVVKYYYSNQDMMVSVQSAVMEQQVVEWMIENAGIDVTDRKMTFSELVDEARKTQVKR